jgi:hypothetical protein
VTEAKMGHDEHPPRSLDPEMQRTIDELNQELQRLASIHRCDKCPNVKRESSRELQLPNGLRISLDVRRCESPSSDCTAEVQFDFMSEPTPVANRIAESLAEHPELKPLDVTWWTCGEARHSPSCPTLAEKKLIAVAGALAVSELRRIKSI